MRLRSALFVLPLLLVVVSCVGTQSQVDKKKQQGEVHYKLGIAHLHSDNPTLALKELLLAVQSSPENSSIQVALAQAYQLKKAYALAEKHYLKAIQLSENDPRYLNNLASLYLDMQRWDKAIEYFDLAGSDLLFFRPHIAVTGKAFAYMKKQQLDEALLYLKEATTIAPGYAPAFFLQSQVYQQQGKVDLEELALQQTLRIAPGYVEARYRLGLILLNRQKLAEAEEQFLQILDTSPDSEWGMKAKKVLRRMPTSVPGKG